MGDREQQAGSAEEKRRCAICGDRKELIADFHIDEVHYCKRCLGKAKRQQKAIDDGYAVEPVVEM